LTERLQRVVEQMAQLSEQEQNDLAARIEADLEEDRRWAAAMDDPHDLVLDHLLAEAKQVVAQRTRSRSNVLT
jgi:hypothetical protein